ncbi:MAG: ribosome recycling factor [Candidatus Margulisiibacteriota bacterium]
MRNIRRDFMETTKKNKLLSEDDLKRQEHEIQKVTDHHNSLVDDLLKHKEKEIMEI